MPWRGACAGRKDVCDTEPRGATGVPHAMDYTEQASGMPRKLREIQAETGAMRSEVSGREQAGA